MSTNRVGQEYRDTRHGVLSGLGILLFASEPWYTNSIVWSLSLHYVAYLPHAIRVLNLICNSK